LLKETSYALRNRFMMIFALTWGYLSVGKAILFAVMNSCEVLIVVA